jgi:hypothetical protein
MGMRVIVNGLNREGIRPRSASAWSQATVQKILSNPVYTGRIAYGRRARGAGGRRMREPVVVTESAAVPVLVSREDWDAVQAMKEGRPGFGRGQGSGRSSVSEPLLTGLLRCKCGHGFAGKAMNGGYRYYRCNGVHQKGSGFCDCGGIRQDVLDDLVVGALRSLYGGQQAKERLVRRVAVKWEQQLIEARAALRGLEKELGRLESGEQRLKRMLRDGELTVAEYRELREDQEREFAAVKAASEKATSLERQALSGLKGQSRLLESLAQVDEWERLAHVGKKQLLRQFIQEIRVYRPLREAQVDCHIVWRWDSEAAGAPPVEQVQYVVAQHPQPAPPRTAERDSVTGRFKPAK